MIMEIFLLLGELFYMYIFYDSIVGGEGIWTMVLKTGFASGFQFNSVFDWFSLDQTGGRIMIQPIGPVNSVQFLKPWFEQYISQLKILKSVN